MLKRLLFLLFASLLTIGLVACGDSETASSKKDSNDNETEVEEESEEESETMTSEENEEKDAKVGDVIKGEAGDSTLVSRTDDVGTFESGPIVLEIEKANGVSLDVNDDFVDMFDSEEVEYIQVDMKVENTSEDNVTFYASQATMTTNTGEQLEPDMLLSDHIDGEYLGEVNKSGSSFYILENSKAEDVESIKLFFSAPDDEDFESVGEDIEVEISLEK